MISLLAFVSLTIRKAELSSLNGYETQKNGYEIRDGRVKQKG